MTDTKTSEAERIAIPHNGSKPAWLEDDATIQIYPGGGIRHDRLVAKCTWKSAASGIRYMLPADHWAAPVLRSGLTPWNPTLQGDGPPKDYAGGKVVFTNGFSCTEKENGHAFLWHDDFEDVDSTIIGYEPAPTPDTNQSDDERCRHGVRYPHPCDDCADADIPPGKRIQDHPCYGLPLDPTGLAHRNSWPLSSKEHPYCSRCGTEIEGPNNKQVRGSILSWEPRSPLADTNQSDALAVIEADRVEAKKLRSEIDRQIGEASKKPLSGQLIEDADFDVQAFARHRIASATTAEKRCAELEAAVDAVFDEPFNAQAHRLGITHWPGESPGNWMVRTRRSAIRAALATSRHEGGGK